MSERLHLVDVLRQHAADRPDRILYRFLGQREGEQETLTFAELDRAAQRIAAQLRERVPTVGVALLLYPPGLEFIRAFFGCLYAGVIAVPVYLPNTRKESWDRLSTIARDAGAGCVLIDAAASADVAQWLDGHDGLAMEALVTSPLHADADAPLLPQAPRLEPKAIAFLQYTSGSTGDPKGVMVSHANLMANQRVMQRRFGHDDSAVVVGWLPPYHDMGLIGNILQPLYLGATAVLMAPIAFLQSPIRWLRVISEYRATTSGGPDFAYRLCAQRITNEDKAGLDLSRWRNAFNGAEPIAAATLTRFQQAFAGCGFRTEAFLPCYGLAEGTLMAAGVARGRAPVTVRVQRAAIEADCALPWDGDAATPSVELVSSGTLDDDSLSIVDPASGDECAAGHIGEIWLRGPSVTQGYWRRDELNRESFGALRGDGAGPWLRTGDLGFVQDGELYVTGRLKDLIIIRGRNFYPQDIEAVVQQAFPALRAGCGACFPVVHAGEETLVLMQELERSAIRHADLPALWRSISQLIAEQFGLRLHALALVKPAQVPKTSSGKLRRKACRALFEAGALDAVARFDADGDAQFASAAAVTAIAADDPQHLLAQVLRLDASRLQADLPLGAYGLDSIQAAQLEHQLRAQWGVELGMTRMLAGLTVGGFVAEVAQARAQAATMAAPTVLAPTDRVGHNQRAIWQIQALQPACRAYHLAVPLTVVQPLDANALGEAMLRLIARHRVLATGYREAEGGLHAVTHAPTVAPLTVIDARDWDAARVERALQAQAAQAIDLETGPVFHACLLQGAPGGTVLQLVVHHIAVDGWSLQVLVRDLAQAYRDCVDGRVPAVTAAAAYPDFVAAQHAWLESAAGQAAITEYRAVLGDTPGVLNLPTDRPRPKQFGFAGHDVDLALDPSLSAQLREHAAAQGVTLFTLLLSAYQVLMHRLSGQDRFLIGAPVSERPFTEFADTVGCFVDLKLFPCTIDPQAGFAAHLAATRAAVLQVLRHKRVPAALALQHSALHGGWPSTTVPNVRFALQQAQLAPEAAAFLLNLPQAHIELSGLSLGTYPRSIGATPADFALTVLEHPRGLHTRFTGNAEIFEPVRLAAIAAMYRELLRSLIADLHASVATLPLLPTDARAALIARSAPVAVDLGPDLCIHTLVEAQARLRPDAVAVVGEWETLTYAQLNRRANRLARQLHSRGIAPEDRVGLYLQRGPDMAVAFLAALKAGACSVMLEPSLPPERCRYIIGNSRMAVLLTNLDGTSALLPPGVAALDLREVQAGAAAQALDEDDLALPLTSRNAAYVIYTSGSTGHPKGVVGLHAGVVNRTRWMIRHFGLGPADRVLHSTPMGFVRAEREILFPLMAGAALVILSEQGLNRPDAVLDALERHRIGFTASSPSLLRMILEQDPQRFARLDALRRWCIGADALRPDLIARIQAALPSLQLTYFYGSTEVSSDVAYFDVPADYATSAATTPIGRALPNTALYLLDAAMEPVADGMTGELYVGGVQLARGYLDQPELTAERFIDDPFAAQPGARLYRSGDLAFRRADGDLVVVGRNDDQVNVYGHRVEPGEIEAAIRALAPVEDAIVLPLRDYGEHLLIVAYVACRDADFVAGLRERLADHLPRYMIPSLFVRLDRLPVTSLGKIDRSALRTIDLSLARNGDHVAPQSPLEQQLVEALSQLLGVPADLVSVQRNFFELGANSALLSQFVVALNRLPLQRPVRIADVYHHHTVRALAAALLGADTGSQTVQRSLDRAQARRQAMARRPHPVVNS
ncbi:MAG: amino acid adenylation domain-containing protein [Luteimonas sp.]